MAGAIRSRGLLESALCTRRPLFKHHGSVLQRRAFKDSSLTTNQTSIPPFAFAFDIDGVLLRSSKPIPGAPQALRELQSRRVPFILLTNGGGKSEQTRVDELSRLLEVPLDTSMFVQSHTPFASLVHGSADQPPLKDEPILVVGGEGDKCRHVAESYGFTNVIIPSDIYHALPEIWPFSHPFRSYHAAAAAPLPLPIFSPQNSLRATPGGHLRIAAILVFNDPRDLGLDTQIVLDLLLSHNGFLGTRSPRNGDPSLPNHGFQSDGQPRLLFANPDLLWAARWHVPRLGSGGFKAGLEGVWHEITGGKARLKVEMGGKPSRGTFAFAEKRITAHREALLKEGGEEVEAAPPLQRVYMVGDNPASDIAGANAFRSPAGVRWSSILVWSGVFQGEKIEDERLQPDATADDVGKAVRWVLEREGMDTSGLEEKKEQEA